MCKYRTISSLHIGQARAPPAAAGVAEMDVSPFSKEMRDVRS